MAPNTKATGHLTASVNETINYLEEFLADVEDSPEKTSMINDHITTLIKSMANEKSDLPDATQAHKVVRQNAAMLGPDNGERLRQSISRSSEKA